MEGKKRLKKCCHGGKWRKPDRKKNGVKKHLIFKVPFVMFQTDLPTCTLVVHSHAPRLNLCKRAVVCKLLPGLLLTEGLSGFSSKQHVTDQSSRAI